METAILKEKKVCRTYVMKGDFEKKELQTYHLILAPSYACNVGCPHCYLPNHATETLPEKRVLCLIDEWSEIVQNERGRFGGIFHLKGGEPLILPYFDSVIEKMAELGTLRFMMTTNGTSYSAKTIKQLAELNEALNENATIIVSLDGSTEEINSILRCPGNYAKTIGFINQLANAGVTFFLNYLVHKHNIDDIPNFMKFARELGATQVNFLSFIPKGYGAELSDYRPDPLDVFNRIQSIWENGDDKIKSMLAGSLSDILQEEACGNCTATECVGGYRGLFYIVPNGDVYSCPNLNFPQLKVGNIMESSCAELMDTKVYEKVRTESGDTSERFLCKGEKFLPQSSEYLITEFAALQRELAQNKEGNGMACCFARNW